MSNAINQRDQPNDWTLPDFVVRLFRGNQFKPTVAILYVCLAGSFWKGFSISAERLESLHVRFSSLFPAPEVVDFLLGAHKILGAFLLFGLLPVLIVKYVFRESLRDYGVCWGEKRRAVRWFVLMGPVMLLAGYISGQQKEFLEVYPLNPIIRPGTVSIGLFVAHAVSYVFYYLGWEFLFRGFLQKALSPQTGVLTAVLIQTLASTMLHFGHPNAEVFSAILGGLFWGFLVVRTRSLLSGLLQHALLGIVLDVFLVFG